VGLPIDIKFRTDIEGVYIGIDRLTYGLKKKRLIAPVFNELKP